MSPGGGVAAGKPPAARASEPSGKVCAGVYALYAGLAVIAIAGILLGPAIHDE